MLNHIWLLDRFYIYSRKCQNGMPALQGFHCQDKAYFYTRPHIAGKRDKLNGHSKKWGKLISVVSDN